jgi:hypothetical protein
MPVPTSKKPNDHTTTGRGASASASSRPALAKQLVGLVGARHVGRGFAVGQPASLNAKLPLEELAEIAASFAPVEPAVGPVRPGLVLRVDAFAGLAHVQDELTGKRFKLSRRFVEPRVFDALRKGTVVRFRDNGHNSVAEVTIQEAGRE